MLDNDQYSIDGNLILVEISIAYLIFVLPGNWFLFKKMQFFTAKNWFLFLVLKILLLSKQSR